MHRSNFRSSMVWAWLAALMVVVAALLLPLQPMIAGDEAYASKTIQSDRDNAAETSLQFANATQRYQTYIKTHDLGALLIMARDAITQANSTPNNISQLAAVRDAASRVIDYAGALQAYAQAGEQYFTTLKTYDDKLMSWTRSLGAASEQLRPATFPFVEHLKNYPPPDGLKTDPPSVSASRIGEQIASLSTSVAALNSNTGDPGQSLRLIDRSIGDTWESGRSVEYVNGLHDTYYEQLKTYDGKVQEVANGTTNRRESSTLAFALSAIFLICTISGIARLFAPDPGVGA